MAQPSARMPVGDTTRDASILALVIGVIQPARSGRVVLRGGLSSSPTTSVTTPTPTPTLTYHRLVPATTTNSWRRPDESCTAFDLSKRRFVGLPWM